MKKYIALLCISALAFGLTACGTSSGTESSGTSAAESESLTASSD